MTISFDDSLKPGCLNFDPGDGEVRGLKAHVGEYSHVAFSLVLVVPEAVLINWSGVAKENMASSTPPGPAHWLAMRFDYSERQTMTLVQGVSNLR
jgi:hypothetical protein